MFLYQKFTHVIFYISEVSGFLKIHPLKISDLIINGQSIDHTLLFKIHKLLTSLECFSLEKRPHFGMFFWLKGEVYTSKRTTSSWTSPCRAFLLLIRQAEKERKNNLEWNVKVQAPYSHYFIVFISYEWAH